MTKIPTAQSTTWFSTAVTKTGEWLKGWWDATDVQKDVTLLGFAAFVVSSIVYLGREQHFHGMSAAWNDAYRTFAAATAIGGGLRAWIDLKRKSDAPQPQEPTPSAGEEGKEC